MRGDKAAVEALLAAGARPDPSIDAPETVGDHYTLPQGLGPRAASIGSHAEEGARAREIALLVVC